MEHFMLHAVRDKGARSVSSSLTIGGNVQFLISPLSPLGARLVRATLGRKQNHVTQPFHFLFHLAWASCILEFHCIICVSLRYQN